MPLLKTNGSRVSLASLALLLLLSVYVFQRIDVSSFLGYPDQGVSGLHFIINRTIRFLLNEVGCLFLIMSIFNKEKYLRIGFYLFMFEFFILLPIYFIMKLSLEGDSEISSPLLSQLHRMIVNPLLMIILILGLVYQDFVILPRSNDSV